MDVGSVVLLIAVVVLVALIANDLVGGGEDL